jgi:hypothetical protein
MNHRIPTAVTHVGTQIRAAQDSMQLVLATMNTLVSDAGFSQLSIRASDCTILNLISGVALLKILFSVLHVDSSSEMSSCCSICMHPKLDMTSRK